MRSSLSTRLNVMLILIASLCAVVLGGPINQAASCNDTGSDLRIVSREEWGARPPKDKEPMYLTPTPYVVIHHGGIPQYCRDQKSCSAIARSYQDLHMDDRGWFDLGYSFLVGEDGNVYEGRGWDNRGAHAPGYNQQSIGVCVMGDFSDIMPDTAALNALNALIAEGVKIGKIRPDYEVIGHRQARKTACPGETFYKYVQGLSRWTPSPVPITLEVTNQSIE